MRLLPLKSYLPTATGLIKNWFSGGAIYPFYASFKITSRCHFGCPFCNMKHDRSIDLPTEDIKKILDNLSRSPVLMTSFEGGEPLLRSDIEELLAHARRCAFYLLFTTSQKNILDYPMERYSRYIDFLHVSMDEGHGNCAMYDLLPELTRLPTQVSVQVVVTRDSVDALAWKVERCFRSGANIVIIPASPMDGADNQFPDLTKLSALISFLDKKYPNTIHTPGGYFKAYAAHRCSSASVIIAPDGHLYYPCHILGTKGPDLRTADLTGWLQSPEASAFRETMRRCDRNCGWYQYYSIGSYISPISAIKSLKPMLFQKKRG